jgi:PPOX class probable FMN-dependent enzyme
VRVPSEVLSSYAAPSGRAVLKEIGELDHYCREFLALCTFAVLSTATPAGEPDLTPRGGEPGFLHVLDPHTLLLPDRLGNNRLDNLRKIGVNPRVALLCLVPGIDETLRIYGRAELHTADGSPVPALEHGRPPRSVMVIAVERAFMHCAKALMRGRLWNPAAQVPRTAFASAGEVLRAHTGASGPAETQEDMVRRYESQL